MIDKDTLVQVRNLTGQTVAYVVPELRVRRVFRDFESKELPASELRGLWYLPGGANLLQNYLAINNKELAAEFGVSEDSFSHEYSWTLEDIKDVLFNGSIDVLADALDFAPTGIVDTIVSQAVLLSIPDMNKQRLITKMTGHDIAQMIDNKEKLKTLGDSNPTQDEPRTRRVGGNKNTTNQGRRVQ